MRVEDRGRCKDEGVAEGDSLVLIGEVGAGDREEVCVFTGLQASALNVMTEDRLAAGQVHVAAQDVGVVVVRLGSGITEVVGSVGVSGKVGRGVVLERGSGDGGELSRRDDVAGERSAEGAGVLAVGARGGLASGGIVDLVGVCGAGVFGIERVECREVSAALSQRGYGEGLDIGSGLAAVFVAGKEECLVAPERQTDVSALAEPDWLGR